MDNFLWIIIVNLALYYKTLRYKFVSDDFAVYHQNKERVYKNWMEKRWLQFIGATKLMGYSVILGKIKGKWKCALIKTEEQEHLIALLLHIAICCMIYVAFGSLPAALLYSVNPVNNQGTIWPGGRGYALPILMILMAYAWPWTSVVTLGFASWFTVGFLAPLCLIGSIKWYLVGVAAVFWVIHAKKFISAVKSKAGSESFTEDRLSFHPRKFILAIKTFGFYTTLCLIPFRITFYHNFLQSAAGSLKHKAYTIYDRYFVIGLLSIGMMIFYWVNVPWNVTSWTLLAWCITIAPFCNFKRANQEIAERFAALPNLFMMYFLAQVVPSPVILAAILAFYATRTYYTLMLYKDEYFVTECAVVEDPHAWWAWHCRAMKRWDNESYKEALVLWVMAKLISPKEFKILINIATVLRLLKKNQEADEYLKMAEDNIISGQEDQSKEILKSARSGKLPILL